MLHTVAPLQNPKRGLTCWGGGGGGGTEGGETDPILVDKYDASTEQSPRNNGIKNASLLPRLLLCVSLCLFLSAYLSPVCRYSKYMADNFI
jgi:hypothetical protein